MALATFPVNSNSSAIQDVDLEPLSTVTIISLRKDVKATKKAETIYFSMTP
jgi:hypothetical protein